MFDFTGNNVFVIGTVGEAPNILLTNNDLRNVPTEFPVSNTDWKGNLMYWAIGPTNSGSTATLTADA